MIRRVLCILLLTVIGNSLPAVAQEEFAEDSLFVAEKAPSNEVSELCARLAARGDVAELQPLYDEYRAELPDYITLYCRLAFARAAGRHNEVSALIDTLESKHAESFDLRGLLALCEVKCEALRLLGDYRGLRSYTKERLDWCFRRGIKASRQRSLKDCQSIATTFAESEAATDEWGSDDFMIPVSRDFPLLFPVSINDGERMPFLLHLSSRYSFISKQDAADLGIEMICPPVSVATAWGMVKATPVIVSILTIGHLTIHSPMLYVVDEGIPAPFNRSLGNDLLRRLQYFEVNDQQICVKRLDNLSGKNTLRLNTHAPLCFTTRGGIDLQAQTDSCWMRFPVGTIETDMDDLEEKQLYDIERLKRFHSFAVNFRAMELCFSGDRDYAPRSIDEYLREEDYFELLRNEASLYYRATDDDVQAIDAAIEKALTPPDKSQVSAAVRQAIVSPEQAAKMTVPSRQLLMTSRGLIYERIEGQRIRTVLLTDKVAAKHKIDLQNMKIY